MISLTLINTVCSSSKQSQKNKWLQKRATRVPHVSSKSASESVTLNEKKNHHYINKIFIVYKPERSPAAFMGIWTCTTSDKIKQWTFLQISFKVQLLITILVLVILYCFEATCLIMFFIFDIWEVSNLLIHFSKASLK